MNKKIQCHCGCGKKLFEIDSWGKKRRFIIGHHPHSRAKKYINHDKTTLNTLKNRFYSKVLLPNENGCMEWISGMKKRKRGLFSVVHGKNRFSTNAARFSYQLHYNIDPKDLYVCHKCDNPKCVAPEHLFLGTQKENMEDMFFKNRKSRAKPRSLKKRNKLKESDVVIIREKLNLNFSPKELSLIFNVSQYTISDIKRYKTWRNI